MKIYDITRELLSAPVYEGDASPELKKVTDISECGFATSNLSMCLHNGTHADAPAHAVKGGTAIADIPPDRFVGRCSVITASKITPKFVAALRKKSIKRLLIRGTELTAFSAFELNFARLWLLGTERPTIGDLSVHKRLLSAGTVILEGLDLSAVPDGEYLISALPVKIAGADGAPVRAVLIDYAEHKENAAKPSQNPAQNTAAQGKTGV